MRRAITLLAGILAATALSAQDEGSAKVEFRVTRFDPGDRPPPTFQAGGAGQRVSVEVPLTYIEGPFTSTLRDGKFLDFYEGTEEKPSLSVAIPTSMRKDLLLVFVPKEGNYHILKVHAPATKIRGGDRFVVNATSGDLAIQLGKTKPILVKTGNSGLLAGPRSGKLETLPVVIKQKNEEEWKLVSTEYWSCDPRFRSFLFAYRSERTGHVVFHGISDRLATPAE